MRPTQFDEEIAEEVLDRIRHGESLRQISLDPSMPTTKTIFHWTNGTAGAEPSWGRNYARARLSQASYFAAQIVELADLTDDTAHNAGVIALNNLSADATDTEKRRAYFYAKKRSVEGTKLAIDARKWVAARMHPGQWGERVTLEHTGNEEKPVAIDMTKLSTEQLEWLGILQKQIAGGEPKQIGDGEQEAVTIPAEYEHVTP
jgi:hypothetical protein